MDSLIARRMCLEMLGKKCPNILQTSIRPEYRTKLQFFCSERPDLSATSTATIQQRDEGPSRILAVVQSAGQRLLLDFPVAVDLLLRLLRDVLAATGELELRGLRLETKWHADLDGTGHAVGPAEPVLGSAERMLPEERLACVHLERGPHRQEAVLRDWWCSYLERRGGWLSATATRLPAAVAVLGGPAGRSSERALHRVDRSRHGIQAHRTGRGA